MNSDEKERLQSILRAFVCYGTIVDRGLKETLYDRIGKLFDEPEVKLNMGPGVVMYTPPPITTQANHKPEMTAKELVGNSITLSNGEIVPLSEIIAGYKKAKEAGL